MLLPITGIVGFFFEYKSLQMIPPATVSVLRTTEIVVAYVVNIILTMTMPEILNIFGSFLVLLAAIALIFEKELDKKVEWICCRRNYDKLDEQRNLIDNESDEND